MLLVPDAPICARAISLLQNLLWPVSALFLCCCHVGFALLQMMKVLSDTMCCCYGMPYVCSYHSLENSTAMTAFGDTAFHGVCVLHPQMALCSDLDAHISRTPMLTLCRVWFTDRIRKAFFQLQSTKQKRELGEGATQGKWNS